MIRRTKNRIPNSKLIQVINATFTSKWFYGAALYGYARIDEKGKKKKYMKDIQILQNETLRMGSGIRMKRREFGAQKLCELI